MIFFLGLISPVSIAAQEDIPIPNPVENFIDMLGQIEVNSGGDPISRDAMELGEGIFGGDGSIDLNLGFIGDIWENINEWMRSTIGISLMEIFQAFANLIIWLLELTVNLIKEGLEAIPR